MPANLRVIAGRPLSVEQQGAVLRNAFTLERCEEAVDDMVDAVDQVMRAMGWVFCVALVITVVFVVAAVVLSIGSGS